MAKERHRSTLDRHCREFERQWHQGYVARIEEYLDDLECETTSSSALLNRLIITESNLRRETGESVDDEEYQARFPWVAEDEWSDLTELPTPPMQREPTPLFPQRYQGLNLAGRGGIGCVWRVRDRQLDRILAAKVLLSRHHSDYYANQRLRRESQLTGSLQHPGVPPVHDCDQLLSGSTFFTMKLVDGQTLSKLLRRRQSISEDRDRFLQIFRQVADTLAYAHSKQVIHRDIKPDNVMVGEFGEVQVMDWGLARRLDEVLIDEREISPGKTTPTSMSLDAPFDSPPDSSLHTAESTNTLSSGETEPEEPTHLTLVGDMLGTPAYMAPEQARGDLSALSPRADVFGLGAMLFEILTGQRLYESSSADTLAHDATIGDLSESRQTLLDSNLDDELVQLCCSCLETDPLDRPSDAGEISKTISSYLTSLEERLRSAEYQRAAAEAARAEMAERRRIKMFFVSVALIALGAAGCSIIWHQYDRQQQRIANNARRADSLVRVVLTAPSDLLPMAIDNVTPIQDHAIPILQREYQSPVDARTQLRAALALGSLGHIETSFLIEHLHELSWQDLPLAIDILRQDATQASDQLLTDWMVETDEDRRARLAAVSLAVGNSGPATFMLSDSVNANTKAAFVDHYSLWRRPPFELVELATVTELDSVRFGAIQAIAQVPAKNIPPETRARIVRDLESRVCESLCPEDRSGLALIAQRWQTRNPQLVAEVDQQQEPTDYEHCAGVRMIKVPLPALATSATDLESSQTERTGTRSEIYISDREVSIGQYRRFLEANPQLARRVNRSAGVTWQHADALHEFWNRYDRPAGEDTLPVTHISAIDAALFCNWLSQLEGRSPYYIDLEEESYRGTYGSGSFEHWKRDLTADGYRLPDEHEYYSLVGEALNGPHSTGSQPMNRRYLKSYEWSYVTSQSVHPIGQLLPDTHGIFDLRGNVGELTDQWQIRTVGTEQELRCRVFGAGLPTGPNAQLTWSDMGLRAYRGLSGDAHIGFRVARTPESSCKARRERIERQSAMTTAKLERRQPMERLRKQVEAATDASELYALSEQQFELGLAFLDEREYWDAQVCFGDAEWNVRSLLRQGHDRLSCGNLLGAVLVNNAIALNGLNEPDQALESLLHADRILAPILREHPQNEVASRFAANSRRVRLETLVERSLELSLAADLELRDGARSLALALDALKLSQHADVQSQRDQFDRVAYALAAAYVECGRSEQAIEWLESALAQAPYRFKPWYQERLTQMKTGQPIASQ